MNKNALIVVIGIIGLSLFIDKMATNYREVIKDPTKQYRFEEKQAELEKQYKEIKITLDKIESDIKTLESMR